MVAVCNLVRVYVFRFLLGVIGGWDALSIITVIKDLVLDHFHKLLILMMDVQEKLLEFMHVEEVLDEQFSMEIL